MTERLTAHRVEVSFVGAPPLRQIERASGVSDVDLHGDVLHCVVTGSFQPFLEALRGHEVISLDSTMASGMRAIVQDSYGSSDALRLAEIDTPVPTDTQVLLRVYGAGINPLDYFTVTAGGFMRVLFGLRKPRQRVRGLDVAGRVVSVGGSVTQFRPGDEVFGEAPGAFAEYACADQSRLALKPSNVTFEQAAASPVAGITALQALRDVAQLQRGQRVLVNGASGGVGTFAVQIARALGAEVIGVCSTRNADLVRSIGADHVIDYTREDFTRSEGRYDVILDNVGNHPLAEGRRVLAPGGRYLYNSGRGGMGRVAQAMFLARFTQQGFRFFIAKMNSADLAMLGELMQSGKVRSVIDETYALTDAARAIDYVGAGHARGKVIISVGA